MMRDNKPSSFILDRDGIQRHVMIPHYQAINDVPLPCNRNKLGVIVPLMRCFNCGSSRHRVSDCKIERNNVCILMNKTWMQDYGRLGVKKDREDEEHRHTRYFTLNEPNSKGDPSLEKYCEPPELQVITEESQPDIYEYIHIPPPQQSIYLNQKRGLTLPPLHFQCPSLTPTQRKRPRRPRTGKPHIAQKPRADNSNHKAGRTRRPQHQQTPDRRERLAAASKILQGKYEKRNPTKHRNRHQKNKPKGTARRSQSQQKQDPRESQAAASKVVKGKNEKRKRPKQRHRHQKKKPQSKD